MLKLRDQARQQQELARQKALEEELARERDSRTKPMDNKELLAELEKLRKVEAFQKKEIDRLQSEVDNAGKTWELKLAIMQKKWVKGPSYVIVSPIHIVYCISNAYVQWSIPVHILFTCILRFFSMILSHYVPTSCILLYTSLVTRLYMHTYVHTYLYICMCVCLCKNPFPSISTVSMHSRTKLSFVRHYRGKQLSFTMPLSHML